MTDLYATPTPQQYPYTPADSTGRLVQVIKNQSTQLREVTSNLMSAMGVRAQRGMMSSLDYDGTSRTDLGTAGWMLGADDGGPSFLALNGRDVIADLTAKDAQILELIDSLELTQADLTSTVDYLASLVTRDATAPMFNTGTLAADSTIHYVGTPGSLSIDCPTGKMRVIVSCPEASIACGTGSGAVEAYLSFSVGTAVAMGTYTARLYTAGSRIGASLTRVKTITVPPGTYTVSVQAGYWCSGFTAASIQFADLDLSAEVVNGA